jgi:hypothetical protein
VLGSTVYATIDAIISVNRHLLTTPLLAEKFTEIQQLHAVAPPPVSPATATAVSTVNLNYDAQGRRILAAHPAPAPTAYAAPASGTIHSSLAAGLDAASPLHGAVSGIPSCYPHGAGVAMQSTGTSTGTISGTSTGTSAASVISPRVFSASSIYQFMPTHETLRGTAVGVSAPVVPVYVPATATATAAVSAVYQHMPTHAPAMPRSSDASGFASAITAASAFPSYTSVSPVGLPTPVTIPVMPPAVPVDRAHNTATHGAVGVGVAPLVRITFISFPVAPT